MVEPKNISTKAYVVESKGSPFVLRDVILDEVQPNEVLVEIKYTGLCHTDIVVQQGGMPIGSYPAVLGHEGVGVIRYLGSGVADQSLSPGNIVLLSFHSCRRCRPCTAGRCGSCPHMTETNFIKTAREGGRSPISLPDGTPVHGQFFGQSSLSKLAVVAETSVVRVQSAVQPADLPFLAPLGCGYLTGAGTVFNVLKPERHDKVVVLGMGAVGLAAVMAARALGVETVVGVDMVDSKLELASTLGATHTLNTKTVADLNAGIRGLCAGGADFIIDATGVPALHGPAVKALAHEGTLAFVGVPPPTARLEVDTLDLLLSCKRLIGVIEGQADPHELIPRLVELYLEGKFPIDRVSKCYPAESLSQALEDMKSGTVVKPVLSWNSIN